MTRWTRTMLEDLAGLPAARSAAEQLAKTKLRRDEIAATLAKREAKEAEDESVTTDLTD